MLIVSKSNFSFLIIYWDHQSYICQFHLFLSVINPKFTNLFWFCGLIGRPSRFHFKEWWVQPWENIISMVNPDNFLNSFKVNYNDNRQIAKNFFKDKNWPKTKTSSPKRTNTSTKNSNGWFQKSQSGVNQSEDKTAGFTPLPIHGILKELW